MHPTRSRHIYPKYEANGIRFYIPEHLNYQSNGKLNFNCSSYFKKLQDK